MRDVVGNSLGEPSYYRLSVRHFVGACIPVPARPALDLASWVAGAPVEVTQAGRRGVHRVEVREGVNEVKGELPQPGRLSGQVLREFPADDPPRHEGHDVQ